MKYKDKKVENFERKFGAQGSIWVRSITENDGELNVKGRVFFDTSVLPHFAVGNHIHKAAARYELSLRGG